MLGSSFQICHCLLESHTEVDKEPFPFQELVEDIQSLLATSYFDEATRILFALTCRSYLLKYRKKYSNGDLSAAFQSSVGDSGSLDLLLFLSKELEWSAFREIAFSQGILDRVFARQDLDFIESCSWKFTSGGIQTFTILGLFSGLVALSQLNFLAGRYSSRDILNFLTKHGMTVQRSSLCQGAASSGNLEWIKENFDGDCLPFKVAAEAFKEGHIGIVDWLFSKGSSFVDEDDYWDLNDTVYTEIRDPVRLLAAYSYLEKKGVAVAEPLLWRASKIGAVEAVAAIESRHDIFEIIRASNNDYDLMRAYLEYLLRTQQFGKARKAIAEFDYRRMDNLELVFADQALFEASLAESDRAKSPPPVIDFLLFSLEHGSNEVAFWDVPFSGRLTRYSSWDQVFEFGVSQGYEDFVDWCLPTMIKEISPFDRLKKCLSFFEFEAKQPVSTGDIFRAYCQKWEILTSWSGRGETIKSALYRKKDEALLVMGALKRIGYTETKQAIDFLNSPYPDGPKYPPEERQEMLEKIRTIFKDSSVKVLRVTVKL